MTWDVPCKTDDVCGPITENKGVRLESSIGRAQKYFLPKPLDFFGYFLSVIKQISVLHLSLCLVPMAFPVLVWA